MIAIERIFAAFRKSIFNLACCGFLLILLGCQHTYQVHVYQGPHLSEDKLAKVTLEVRKQTFFETFATGGPYTISFETIDYHDPKKYGEGVVIPKDVYVLPGSHRFRIIFRGPGVYSGGGDTSGGAAAGLVVGAMVGLADVMREEFIYDHFNTVLRFEAAANHKYLIRFKETTKPWKGVVDVKYWVEDVNSCNIVLGEKPTDLK
jgi:hypothetical protein